MRKQTTDDDHFILTLIINHNYKAKGRITLEIHV